MKKKCKAEVWDRFISCGCQRLAGHGPNGDFCKQHAREYLMESGSGIKTMYKVYLDNCDKPSIVEIAIVEESEKTLYVKNSDQRYIGYLKTAAKDTANGEQALYLSREAALYAFIKGQESLILSLQKNLSSQQKLLDWAKNESEEVKKEEENA